MTLAIATQDRAQDQGLLRGLVATLIEATTIHMPTSAVTIGTDIVNAHSHLRQTNILSKRSQTEEILHQVLNLEQRL